jgi:hypothetical protein
MKTLFGMIITMTFMFAGAAQAGPLMSMEDCRDALYEGGGARTLGDATAVCYERRDEAFVGCVQDRYQDSAQSHTFNTAVSLCRTRVVDYVRVCQDHMYRLTGIDWGVAKTLCEGTNTNAITNCIVDAKRLGFNIGRSVQLCQWTTERSVYLCTERLIRANGYNNEQALMQCYSEFNRDELNGQGVNMRQVEREQREQRQKQQEAARRADERDEAARAAADRHAQAAQRAADQRAEAARRAADQREEQRRQDQDRRDQNNTYRPPAPPPPVRTQHIPVVDKGQPVQPARPVVKPAPAAPPVVRQEPVKPVTKPVESKPAKPVEQKPAPPVKPVKPTVPAKPSAPYQEDDSDLPPSVRPEDSANNNKPAPPAAPAPEKPTPVPTADCNATKTCGNDGVIVDLPNL